MRTKQNDRIPYRTHLDGFSCAYSDWVCIEIASNGDGICKKQLSSYKKRRRNRLDSRRRERDLGLPTCTQRVCGESTIIFENRDCLWKASYLPISLLLLLLLLLLLVICPRRGSASTTHTQFFHAQPRYRAGICLLVDHMVTQWINDKLWYKLLSTATDTSKPKKRHRTVVLFFFFVLLFAF